MYGQHDFKDMSTCSLLFLSSRESASLAFLGVWAGLSDFLSSLKIRQKNGMSLLMFGYKDPTACVSSALFFSGLIAVE